MEFICIAWSVPGCQKQTKLLALTWSLIRSICEEQDERTHDIVWTVVLPMCRSIVWFWGEIGFFAFQSEDCEDIKGTLVKINYQHNCALILEVSNFGIKSHFIYDPFFQYLLPLPTSAVSWPSVLPLLRERNFMKLWKKIINGQLRREICSCKTEECLGSVYWWLFHLNN